MKNILNIPPLSQRDARWTNQRLGTVNATTIGSHGCVITCMSMLASYYNHPILPNALDNILTDKKLYFDGNLYVNDSITKIFPDIKFDKIKFYESVPADIAEIKRYIDKGYPVVAALINPGPIRHYVLVVGYENEQLIVNDPWMGDQVNVRARWGDSALKILQVNYFSGPVPKVVTPAPSPEVMPSYFKNLLIEYGLDLNKEGLIREFFSRGRAFDGLSNDKASLEKALNKANVEIDGLKAELKSCQEKPKTPVKTTEEKKPDKKNKRKVADEIEQSQSSLLLKIAQFFEQLSKRKDGKTGNSSDN